jgi:branched-subunit amino acid transport protein
LWLIVIGMGLVTYAVRLSMLAFVRPSVLPVSTREALRFVTPAVLAAIILPAVLYSGGNGVFDAGPGNERLLATALAALVAWTTRNVWATIAAGMAGLWLLEALY